MRRNRPEGRMGMMSAPLMTEHLQNLDLELELLKRKREMIEQQQRQMFNEQGDGYGRQRNFNFNSSHHSNSNRSFQNSYDDYEESKPFSRDFGHSSRKRSGGPSWHDRSPPKRFSGPNKNNARKSFGPSPGQRGPRSSSTGHRSQSDQRHPPPRPAAPSKQTKTQPLSLMDLPTDPIIFNQNAGNQPLKSSGVSNKSKKSFKPTNKHQPPNKLSSYPEAQRKALVTEASSLTAPVNRSELILRADKEPTLQMTGRLELALGNITKQIRERYEDDERIAAFLLSQYTLRAVKQEIRVRIRKAMLGKVVDNINDIVATYRAMYPPETDQEIVKLAIGVPEKAISAPEELPDTVPEPDHPIQYFKDNMRNLIDTQLSEMFKKLEDLYANELKSENDNVTDENSQTKNKDNFDNTEDFSKDVAIVEKPDQANEDKSDKIEPADNFYIDVKPDENIDNKDKSDKIESNNDFSEDVQIVDETNTTNTDKPITEIREMNQGALNYRIKKRLLYLLPKYKSYIIKLLEMDKTYRQAKASIMAAAKEKVCNLATQKKFNKIPENPKHVKDGSEANTATGSEDRSHLNIPYFVKMMGRPVLPKRKVMQAFLDQFYPKSIKRHKNRPNLLFVGLGTKEDFDNAMAANGTVIGQYTLDIRASGSISKNQNSENSNATQMKNIDIGSDLDKQIDNLLSSIKESEEDVSVIIQETAEEIFEVPDEPEEKQETTNVENAEVEAEKSTIDKDVINIDDNIETTMETVTEENVENDTQETEVSETAKNEKSGTENNDNHQVDDTPKGTDSTETTDNISENSNVIESVVVGSVEPEDSNNKVEALKDEAKDTGKGSPARITRSSNQTPSTIKTRRASRLAQNN